MANGNKKLIKAVLSLSSSYLYINIGIFVVVFGSILKTFSEHDSSIVNMIYLIPNLITIPFIFIGGKLCTWFSKKMLLITGFLVFSLAGAATLMAENIYYVLVMRSLVGVGMGMLYPLARALAVQYFDGTERASSLGLMQAVSCILGVLTALLAGKIATVDYHYSMFLYLSGILIAGFAMFALPKDQPEKEIYQRPSGNQRLPGFGSAYYVFLASVFVMSVLLVINQLKLAHFITSEKIGSPIHVGITNSLVFLSGFFGGLMYGKIYSLINRFSAVVVCSFFCIGFLMMYSAHSLASVYIANILMGIGVGVVQPYFVARISDIVPKERATMAIAYLGVVYSTAYFLASYMVPFLEGITGSTTIRTAYLLWGIAWGICCLIALLTALFAKKVTMMNSEQMAS